MMNKIMFYRDLIGIKILKLFRNILLIKRGIKVNTPIELQTQFLNIFKKSSDIDNFVKLFFSSIKINFEDLQDKIQFSELTDHLKKEATIFESKPYQVGGLDVEIKVIIALLAQFPKARVLEIGVANGYSSAFLYKTLDFIKGSIVSVDLPRYAQKPTSLIEQIHEGAAKRNFIKNTGTIIDLNPGGVIPPEKYGGWMVPYKLRKKIQPLVLYGNIFNVIEQFDDNEFNFIVIDAMKDYKERINLLKYCERISKNNCIVIFDGYWVNEAFHDYCKSNDIKYYNIGKVGVFKIKKRK
jgi:predicted O-methyltransferase YrrM